MNALWKYPDRMQFLWPVTGVALAAFAGTNPFFRPHIPLEFGLAAWFLEMVLVLILSLHPATVPAAVLVGGLLMGVPCFLGESPMLRSLLMCCAAFPFALATMQLFAAPTASFRERMACAFTWLGTREVNRTARSVDTTSLLHLVVSTLAFVLAMAVVKAVPSLGLWWLARWLAGGIMILAFAEMITAGHQFLTALMGLRAPALMQSPIRSTTVGEFWAERWNPLTSLGFRTFVFAPLTRVGAGLAMFATFLASAIAHALLPYMATGQWGISLLCGSFFLIQPVFIIAERRMKVRRWRPAAGRVWTLSTLAVASPLFVEPALQVIEPSWGTPDNVLQPALVVLGFVMLVNALYALASLATIPESDIAET